MKQGGGDFTVPPPDVHAPRDPPPPPGGGKVRTRLSLRATHKTERVFTSFFLKLVKTSAKHRVLGQGSAGTRPHACQRAFHTCMS